MFCPHSALATVPSEPGFNLVCYPQMQVTRLTFFMSHIYCLQGLPFPNFLLTDICLVRFPVLPEQSLNQYCSHGFSFPSPRSQRGLSQAPCPVLALSIPRRCALTWLY